MESDENCRYFSWLDLSELFSFGDPYNSKTCFELAKLHEFSKQKALLAIETRKLMKHGFYFLMWIDFIGVFGVSDNGQLYEQINNNINIFNNPEHNIPQNLKNSVVDVREIDSLYGDDFEKMLLSSTRMNSVVFKVFIWLL